MFSRYLSHRDGTLSEASTAVNSPGYPETPPRSREGSLRYTGPKRTFSLVRGDGKKSVLCLVDKPVHILDKTTGGDIKGDTPNALADCLVDFIQLGRLPQPTTIFDAAEKQPDSSLLAVSYPTNSVEPKMTSALPRKKVSNQNSKKEDTSILKPSGEQWTSLEVGTGQFLSSVVPSWTTEVTTGDLPQKHPKLTTVIKAFIKRNGKGFIIRLLRRTKTGFDEVAGFGEVADFGEVARFDDVADIHMIAELCCNQIHELDATPLLQELEVASSTRSLPRASSTGAPGPVSDTPRYSYAKLLREPESITGMSGAWVLGSENESSAPGYSRLRNPLGDELEENLGREQSPVQNRWATQRQSGKRRKNSGQSAYEVDDGTSEEEGRFPFQVITLYGAATELDRYRGHNSQDQISCRGAEGHE